MNNEMIARESGRLADKLLKESSGDVPSAVRLAYRTVLGRPPSGAEIDYALTYVGNDPARVKELGWLLFNLDEFVYVK